MGCLVLRSNALAVAEGDADKLLGDERSAVWDNDNLAVPDIDAV